VPTEQVSHQPSRLVLYLPGPHAGVGAAVGTCVGVAVGSSVGDAVGSAVGEDVGAAVGTAVGCAVGCAVGLAVGAVVGTATHSVCDCRPAVHVVAAQRWQVWNATWSWYLPLGQWKQLVLPVHALYRPVWHSVHSPPELVWNWPTGQGVHPVDSTCANVPLSHASHDFALYALLYVPGAQRAHPPVSAVYVPGMQAGVGDSVGKAVGTVVGVAVGSTVGNGVGTAVGDGVGVAVGCAVGICVGCTVGAAVGTIWHADCDCWPLVHFPSSHALQWR